MLEIVLSSQLRLLRSSISGFFFRRLTTLCLRLRPPCAFRFPPIPNTAACDPELAWAGLSEWPPESWENVQAVLMVLMYDCARDSIGVTGGLLTNRSPRSVGPAQALKTASCMVGVNRDSVFWEFVKTPRRNKFFCENKECVSELESSERETICVASSVKSTRSWGGLANGSTALSPWGGLMLLFVKPWSSLSWYSGTHRRKDSRWIMAGTSSIRRVRSCPSISICRYSLTNGMESKVEETLRDSSGSLRKTKVRPFCLENTSMINAESLISERVILRGIVRPEAAASGWGEVK